MAGCADLGGNAPGARIVSIDYCADQVLLGMVHRSRIAAVSVDVASDPLFSLPRARGIPRVRPSAEEVLALRPTLVVRSYGGGPRFETVMRRAGVATYTLPYAGSLADIGPGLSATGARLNAAVAASTLRANLAAAVSRARNASRTGDRALYVTPGDVTAGTDSLVADILRTAGYRPYLDRAGWHRLPLERLAGRRPAIVVRGFHESRAYQQDRWAASGHGLLTQSLKGVPVVDIPGSELACGNWLVGSALDRLSSAPR